jgi:hypothetical protein
MSDSEGKTTVGKPKVKWARDYDRCVYCGGNEVKHRAQGLCATCYERESHVRNKGYRLDGQSLRRELTEEYLRQEYLNNKRSMIDIAKEIGCTRQAIYNALKKFSIASRSREDASDLALRRGKKRVARIDDSGQISVTTLDRVDVNEGFFSVWSPAMAYVLGVIYTDGSVDPGYKIDPSRRSISKPRLSIAQKEPELLEKVLALMGCNAKLRYRKEHKYGSFVSGALYWFEIASEKIYHDLLTLGVTPKKSLTLSFPRIPKPDFARHFIRGCWDGDGTVIMPRDRQKGHTSASIVSGSQDFITGLADNLYHVGIKRRSGEPLSMQRERNAYKFTITGRDNLTLLFHHLYDWVDSSLRLERKYLKFLDIMKLYDPYFSLEPVFFDH